jgi:Uma2 family endonuclease
MESVVTPKGPQTESFITLEEFLRLPETEPASEFADGKVIEKVSPQIEHSRIQFMLCLELNRTLNPAFYALPELRCTFAGRSLVPDIAVFRPHRLPRNESGKLAGPIFWAPDAAIEIRSPEQPATHLVGKLGFCVENGVPLGVLVDPVASRVVVFRPGDYPEQIAEDGSIEGGDALPGLRISLAELWGWLRL